VFIPNSDHIRFVHLHSKNFGVEVFTGHSIAPELKVPRANAKHINTFIQRLVTILQTIIGTGIGRTQFQSEILSTLIDLVGRGSTFESKISYGKPDESRFLRRKIVKIELKLCIDNKK